MSMPHKYLKLQASVLCRIAVAAAFIVALPVIASAQPFRAAIDLDPSPPLDGPPDSPVPHGGGLACQYSYDDGTAETAYGIPTPAAGYETVWVHRFDAVGGCQLIRAVEVAWSRPGTANPVPAGSPARVFVWDDPNDDGNWSDAVVLAEQETTVQNPATNILNVVSLAAPVVVNGSYMVGASWASPDAIGRFPAALDSSAGIVAGRSFLGSFTGPFSATDITGGVLFDVSTLSTTQGYFLLRASVRSATPITYQGRLVKDGLPVDGPADFRVSVFSAATGGSPIGTTCEFPGVAVVGGLFTLELPTDPLIFDGSPHWLEIQVAHPAPGTFSKLSPRQQIARTPQADYAERTRWSGLMGIPAGFADGVDNGGDGHSLDAADGSPVDALFCNFLGNVGIGTGQISRKLSVTDSSDGALTFPQILQNEGSAAGSAAGLLFRVDPGPNLGKGALAYERTAPNGLGTFHFLQDPVAGPSTPTLANAVMSITSAGDVGIGTKTPLTRQHVSNFPLSIPAAALENDDLIVESLDATLGLYSDQDGTWSSAIAMKEMDGGVLVDTWGIARQTSTSGSELAFTYGTSNNYANNPTVLGLGNGVVGVNTLSPLAELHVSGVASDTLGKILVTPGIANSSSEIQLSENTSATIGFIMRYEGATTNQLQLIGLAAGPTESVVATFDRDNLAVAMPGSLAVTGNITAASVVANNVSEVARFNRLSNGTIVGLHLNGVEAGNISVTGATVSYNAFTGSHYGWTDRAIARGSLVVMTGANRRRVDDPGSEPIYGIAPSTTPNDPHGLGAYLGVLEPAKAHSLDNPHQIMAVGNGDIWVVDSGRDIQPGDYLISSDVEGHAMLDDAERFPIGHIIARAAEAVDWTTITDTVASRRHRRISVFFESFERGNSAALAKRVERQQVELEALRARNAELDARLNRIETLLTDTADNSRAAK